MRTAIRRKSIKTSIISKMSNFERIITRNFFLNIDGESGKTRKKSGKSKGKVGEFPV